MSTQPSDLDARIDANRNQLRAIADVDELFVHSHWASERALVAFIPRTARTILDIGCGPTGGMLMHVPDMVYVGVDFVTSYLAKLYKDHGSQGPWPFARRAWVTSPMETLPFPDGFFDVVYSRHALEHSADLAGTLAEIRRVLKPGGIFLFCVPARVDDTEPTHLTRWPGWRWREAFRAVGPVRFQAHHRYFIDEFYGCVEKPGGPRTSWVDWLRQNQDFLYGQGVIPLWLVRVVVGLFRRLRGVFPALGR
ncbi:MAG TPA: class I SAM-dependent methyltransferase [Anaerolineales bacterium]|nr:class I SAM-dependent methyltransferase [Anaerolineales bacterium]